MPDNETTTTTGLDAGTKYERKWLAHLLLLGASWATAADVVRLGKDLEEYAVNMNPDVEQKKNILGESSVNIKGYQPSSSVDTFYAYKGDALFNKLYTAINNRTTGTGLKARVADILLDGDGTVDSVYCEDVYLVPQSMGGEDGIQIPFEMYYAGNRKAATATISDGVITVSES